MKLTTNSFAAEVKDATGGFTTVTTWVVVDEPPAFVAVKVTVYVPGTAKGLTGFGAVLDGPPSPKFHSHSVGSPVDVSVKRSG